MKKLPSDNTYGFTLDFLFVCAIKGAAECLQQEIQA